MAGGGSRKDDGLKIGSTNGFAVLESLKKKKKSDKESSKSKGGSKGHVKDPEPPVFWNPKPLVNKSWADVDDEDDDDYYLTTAPPQSVWGASEPTGQKKEIEEVIEELQESESEDSLDEGDDDIDEEPEAEPEAPIAAEPAEKKPPTTSAPKDTDRQLSKKELKKKGLEELDAVLAELGMKDNANQEQQSTVTEVKKLEEQNGEGGKKESTSAPAEGKATSKKKKSKKDKSAKEIKEGGPEQPQPNGSGPTNDGLNGKESSTVDVKERLKKVVSTKKKKTSKEMDAAAKAAAVEAAARSARLAAAKKKEKNHYNQQPVR